MTAIIYEKSVFRFDVQGQVAKPTRAGSPWLHYMRQYSEDRVHFWPFDGWTPPPGWTRRIHLTGS